VGPNVAKVSIASRNKVSQAPWSRKTLLKGRIPRPAAMYTVIYHGMRYFFFSVTIGYNAKITAV
jgi:hypothetical protein